MNNKHTGITYAVTYLLSMEQSPSWGANHFSASQENLCVLWNPKVHFHIHKCPPPVPVLRQINPVHAPPSSPSHFLKVHFKYIEITWRILRLVLYSFTFFGFILNKYIKLEGYLTVHFPHEIIWNSNLMQQGNFINVFLAWPVSGTYAHHQEH